MNSDSAPPTKKKLIKKKSFDERTKKFLNNFHDLLLSSESNGHLRIGIKSLSNAISLIFPHIFERITRYNLGPDNVGNSLETVGSYANNS